MSEQPHISCRDCKHFGDTSGNICGGCVAIPGKHNFEPIEAAEQPAERKFGGYPPHFVEGENPKKRNGSRKPPLHLVPTSAIIHAAMAFRDGAWVKGYGPYNWRERPVEVTTYVDAAERHLRLFLEGQRLTSDSKVHNLGAVIACCAILIDAEEFGNLIDDRPPVFDFERVLNDWTMGHGPKELNDARSTS